MRGPAVTASRASASAVEAGGGGGTASARIISSAHAAIGALPLSASSDAPLISPSTSSSNLTSSLERDFWKGTARAVSSSHVAAS